ncbi:MAG: DUF6033 family protein [[Clostridium] nexile]
MKLEALSGNSPQIHSSFENSKIPSGSDTFKTADSLIDELKSKYNHLNFTFLSFANQSELKDYASASSGTNNVIIAPELLDKMLADTSVYNKVTGILDNFSKYKENAQFETLLSGKTLTSMGLVLDENANLCTWTASSENREQFPYVPSSEKNPYGFDFSYYETKKDTLYKTPYKYSHSSNMMRLANAKNVTSVRGLIASKYSEISKVKLEVTDKAEAASIIRKIKAVIQNGNIKIARSKEERIYEQKNCSQTASRSNFNRIILQKSCSKEGTLPDDLHDDIFQSSEELKYQNIIGAQISSPSALPRFATSFTRFFHQTSPVTVSVSINISV